mmetsp:Transcript_12454/g.21401  ORF Transcript_12454/g.21401 Transcript_12454/m.21401 type:complete len:772 (-) Transcript_12454:439-2754(-)
MLLKRSFAAAATAIMALAGLTSAQYTEVAYTPSLDSVEFEYTTMFTNEAFAVTGTVSWTSSDSVYTGGILYCMLTINDEVIGTQEINLTSARELETSCEFDDNYVTSTGAVSAEMVISFDSTFSDNTTSSGSVSARVIQPGASLVPLIMTLFFAIALQKVEIALYLGVFIGSCMVYGNLMDGFWNSIATYLLGAVTDSDHQYVIVFSLFLSGLVTMMQRTGGAQGLTDILVKFARNARWAQIIAFSSGLLIFFDDYTNSLVIGNTMRPILDNFVSREKTAWITDATSAPIASISPISSWVGFEVSLIQTELDNIIADNGGVAPDGLPTSAYAVFLQTIGYRYYPIFLIVFQVGMALMQRDFGPMLIAERKIFITGRTDGGDGAFKGADGLQSIVTVRPGTPIRAYNMLIPVAILILLVFWILVSTGRSSSDEGASFLDVIQNSDSYSALLIGTAGTAVCSMVLYMAQFVKDGRVVIPNKEAFINLLPTPCAKKLSRNFEAERVGAKDSEEETYFNVDYPRPLLGPVESFQTFLKGLINLFPAILVLILAWTIGGIMTEVGCDRLFARAIESDNFNVGMLPTLTFVIAAFMSVAMGSSWSTMSVMFPLVTAPAWQASEGDLNIFYGTMAAVLAGSVTGDHSSPISDTTVLSALAAKCELTAHVKTQAPYAFTVAIVCIFCGTLPVGTGGYSTGAGVAVGIIVTLIVGFLLGAPVRDSPSGRFDIMTELYMRATKNEKLMELKEESARVYAEKKAGTFVPQGKTSDEVSPYDL